MPDTVEDYGSVCVFAYLCSGKKAIMKDIFRRYMVFVAGLYFYLWDMVWQIAL